MVIIIIAIALLCGCSLFSSPNKKDENEEAKITFFVDGKEYKVVETKEGILSLPTEPSKERYAFGGWFSMENGGGGQLQEGDRISTNTKAYAHWLKIHTVTIDFGGRIAPLYSHAIDGQNFSLGEIITLGYNLEGFYHDADLTSPYQTTQAVYGDITVYGKITPIEYTITYSGLDGAIHQNLTSYNVETAFTLSAPQGFYDKFFDGWYDNESKVSDLDNMIGDLNLEARWSNYQRIDSDGTPMQKGNYLLWGFCPQTIKADDVTLTDTVDKRGYILGSDNCYYAPLTANPDATSLENGIKFSNGKSIAKGETYYFKVEPLKWKINSYSTGTNPIVQLTSIIDVAPYKLSSSGTHPNYYQNSTLHSRYFERDIVNYFALEQQRYVAISEVATTGAHAGISEPAEDDIAYTHVGAYFYTFSVREVSSMSFGFTHETKRQIKATDYAIAKGVLCDGEGNACWWTRSHASSEEKSIYAQMVDFNGNVTPVEIYSANVGVLPVCQFSFTPFPV